MRIDASGNLLVGQSTSVNPGAGNTIVGAAVNGFGLASFSRDGNLAGTFNRNTSDGSLVGFYKDGVSVGSISTESGDLNIGTGDTGLQFADSIDSIRPFNITTNADRDAAVDLGVSYTRFKNLHLSGYASVNALASPDGTSIVFPTNAGNVGIGETSPSSNCRLHVTDTDVQMELEGTQGANSSFIDFDGTNLQLSTTRDMKSGAFRNTGKSNATLTLTGASGGSTIRMYTAAADNTTATERMRIASDGKILFGMTAATTTSPGAYFAPNTGGFSHFVVANTTSTIGEACIFLNRHSSDGDLIIFRQADIDEGKITVSGSTVSYLGGHISRWSRLPDNSVEPNVLKGTVLTNLDAMVEWEGEENEQLNQMAISSVEGDPNVAGVFVSWDFDEGDEYHDMNVAMTGDMIIRIAQGTTVQRGDLLMSAGDGTAKPQGDDIVRSKTIAKVTSTHVTCTYADGSYCVPCVLMAC